MSMAVTGVACHQNMGRSMDHHTILQAMTTLSAAGATAFWLGIFAKYADGATRTFWACMGLSGLMMTLVLLLILVLMLDEMKEAKKKNNEDPDIPS